MRLLSFLFLLLSINSFAGEPFKEGDKLTDKRFNNQSFMVGDIKETLLSLVQFQTLAGDCWVKMEGQDVAGSDYAALTGKNILPNTEGRFLRDLGGNAPNIGENQSDAMRNITGQFYSANLGANSRVGNGAFRNIKQGTTSAEADNDAENNETNGWDFDASREVPTANENRPVNTGVNFFVKINDECH